MSVAALTRETMLIAVVAIALWEVAHAAGDVWARLRRIVPLAVPFATYLTWIVVLRLRLGDWPFNRSHDRLSAPGVGDDGLGVVKTLPNLRVLLVGGSQVTDAGRAEPNAGVSRL